MSRVLSLWFAAVLILTVGTLPVLGGPGPKLSGPGGPPGPPGKMMSRKAGEAFCPSAALVYGSIIIPGGRCYFISLLRDTRGTFLAFAPEDAHIPPGQLVRLNTPAGPKLKGRLFLVPIYPSAVITPINTVTLIATQIQDYGPHLSITVVGTPVPNLIVVFNVQI